MAPAAHAQQASWWKPTADQRIAFHWVLDGPLDLNDPIGMGLRDFTGNVLPAPDVYSIDGDDNPASTVASLHAAGKKVICYFDAGVYEAYREDAYKYQQLSPQIWGDGVEGWPEHYWLDIRRIDELEPIIKARMQNCKDKGFDAIEPDDIDGYTNVSGFDLTYQDQLNFNKALASWAHELGMSIGQKNDLAQIRHLADDFDWALNEECYRYSECTKPWDNDLDAEVPGLQLYVQRNKAVFIAEYKAYTTTKWTSICNNSKTNRFNTSRFNDELKNSGGRIPCSTATGW